MILYFSGTGNSQFIALRLAEMLAEKEVISINWYLKSGEKAVLQSNCPLVFVVPTYAWRMPIVVSDWIAASHFTSNLSAYFILTCGGSAGNAATYAKKLCKKSQLEFCGLVPIVMPNNYVAFSNPPSQAECKVLMEKAEEQILSLVSLIQKQEPLPKLPASLKDRMNSGPVCKLFYALIVHDKGFFASDACISCGKCAQRCSLNNIEMVKGKPIWKGHCTHCMACIGGCPIEAIEYKSISKGNRRYYIMRE